MMDRHPVARRWDRPKRHWALLIAAVLLLILVIRRRIVLPWAGDAAWTHIQREGVLRVGMDASYPPFERVDDQGHYSGFDVDLATALAQRWGVTPIFVNVHFDGLYDALKAEKFDLIISALPRDRTMTRDLLYSGSYFNAGQVLVVPCDDEQPQSVSDLDGKCVAVELGAEAHQLVRQLSRDKGLSIEIIARREPEQVVALLGEGTVDALVCDRIAAYGILHREEGLCLGGVPLTNEPYVIAARIESPTLTAEVNAALETWRADGFLEELQNRWF